VQSNLPTMVIRMGPLFEPTSELRDEPSALGPLTKAPLRSRRSVLRIHWGAQLNRWGFEEGVGSDGHSFSSLDA